MARMSPFSWQPARTSQGVVVPASTIQYFDAGETTPLAVFADANETVSLGVSVAALANGYYPVHYVADGKNVKAVETINGTARTYDYFFHTVGEDIFSDPTIVAIAGVEMEDGDLIVGTGDDTVAAVPRGTLFRDQLAANRTYYWADALDGGSDSNDGLTTGTPFATFAHALLVAQGLDLRGNYQLKIKRYGTRTITERLDVPFGLFGQGDIADFTIEGDTTTPTNCPISTTLSCIPIHGETRCLLQGFDVTSSAGEGISIYEGAWVVIGAMGLGACATQKIHLGGGTLQRVAGTTWTSHGNAAGLLLSEVSSHLDASAAATITTSGETYSDVVVEAAESSCVSLHAVIWGGTPPVGVPYRQWDASAIVPADKRAAIPGSGTGYVMEQLPIAAQGRLTLTTAVPVTTSDVTAAATIYWTPLVGALAPVALAVGVADYRSQTVSELSLALDSSSGHTGYHQSGKAFDVFLDLDAGSPPRPRLATGPAWTNDTTRSGAISRTKGVLSNTSSMTVRFGTNSGDTVSRAAGSLVYVGTIYTTADGQTEDSFAKRYVWNMYNRRARPMRALEATDSWNYSTATWRQANASTANQVNFLLGVSEDAVSALATGTCFNNTGTARQIAIGIGLDSTTGFTVGCLPHAPTVASMTLGLRSSYSNIPAAGRHYLAWLEIGAGADTQTWYGDGGVPTVFQSGITGEVWA